ncbi:MAG: hypothetical protein R2797_12850 [Gelidibacter sp.]
MNVLNWKSTKEVLADKNYLALKLLLIFITVYLISTGMDHKRVKLPLLCIGLFLIVFFVKNLRQPLLWYIFLTILISDLICDYFVRANHHFLLIYITILVIIFLHNGQYEDFITNIKLLAVIVLLFSGIQKLVSPQFVSGDFYYYMINTGSFFKPLLYFNPEMKQIVAHNHAQISELALLDPNTSKIVTFQNVLPNLAIISHIFAWFTIIIEMGTAILIFLKPKHLVTHALFISLILGIFLTRLENGFLTLLAISGIWLSEHTRIRAIYSVLAIVFITLIIINIGFY